MDDEQAQIRLAAAGDRDAFKQLYDRHAPWVSAFVARRVTRNDVEDVVADTFVRAWQALPTYQCRGHSLRAWLARIASRLIIDRARRAHPEAPTAEPHCPPVPDFTDALVATWDAQQRVAVALRGLTPEQRGVIVLRYLDGLDTHEAATVLGISPEAVRARCSRAMTELRRSFGETPTSPTRSE